MKHKGPHYLLHIDLANRHTQSSDIVALPIKFTLEIHALKLQTKQSKNHCPSPPIMYQECL